MLAPSAHAYGGKAQLLLGITWAETSIATVFVAARAYSALRIVDTIGWDLLWVVVAWIVAFTAQSLITLSVAYGIGNHIDRLTPEDIVQGLKWSWMGQIVAVAAIGFGKIAVIALLLRIQGPTHKKKSLILHFIWISNSVINTAQVILILKQCSPVQKIWDDTLPGNCDFRTTTSRAGFFQGSWAAASDIALALYPISIFWQLSMYWKKKLALSALMGGGLIAAIAAIVKTVYIKLITATSDITYAIYPLIIWACTEMWLIIILGSIPQLKKLFAISFSKSKLFLSSSRNRTSSRKASEGFTNDGNIDLVYLSKSGGPNGANADNRAIHTNESEEDILPRVGDIMVTTNYTVAYDT